ncbi:hypothetical protein GCM10009799_33620 [Nocardiopsis rhodophaea]|uniref:Uncharacterized protein n=1 Tax=Nocardiopsis rhodophaea TaxID=280238 RepID=A0ABN2TBR3_9ACTN
MGGEAELLARFWNVSPATRLDIVCSEIPEEERPYFASPADRNYLRYAKFADLDTLIYVKTRIAQICPQATVRDFAPSEYHDANADTLIVIGGPPWNSKYREFLPQLPYYFEPHELGEDDPLIVPALNGLSLGPVWSPDRSLLEDVAILTRLALAQGTTVYLLGGCLTLGVLGAAKLCLDSRRGVPNVSYAQERIGEDDFVLVCETRRLGGITDTAVLGDSGPLLLMSRAGNAPFTVLTDNTERYRGSRR